MSTSTCARARSSAISTCAGRSTRRRLRTVTSAVMSTASRGSAPTRPRPCARRPAWPQSRPDMSLTVVGSVAFDALKTPFGERERILGGAATHFSLSASYFADVRVVGVVGEDFGEEEFAILHGRGINTDDIERVEGARSFFWKGHYDYDLDVAHTLDTQLNVFADFEPKLSPEAAACSVLFLANIQPDLQRGVREQCTNAKLAGLDSMNYWIETAKDSLVRTIGMVDAVLLNE